MHWLTECMKLFFRRPQFWKTRIKKETVYRSENGRSYTFFVNVSYIYDRYLHYKDEFFKSIIEQVYELSQWEIKYQDDEKLKLSLILMQRIIRLTEEHRNIAGDGLTPLDRLFVSRDYLNVIQGHGTTLLTAIISICSDNFSDRRFLIIGG